MCKILNKLLPLLLICFISSYVYAAESKPVVNVIVSGKSPEHVKEVFEEIKRLSKRVPIRNVYLLLADTKDSQKYLYQMDPQSKDAGSDAKPTYFVQVLRSIDLLASELKMDTEVLNRLRVSYSPTWVVRYRGYDYVFEGYPSVTRHFTSDGVFNESF